MRAIGIILAGGKAKRLKELTERRSVAAMPIGGSYRSIDFALSSMSNSGIRTVAVLTQYNARSLTEHLNSSKWWNFGRKNGGLFILSPTMTPEGGWYKGTADAMYQNYEFLLRHKAEYVIISNSDCIYKMDFDELIDYHAQKEADITVVYKRMPEGTDISRYGVMQLDENDVMTDFEEKPVKPIGNVISAGIYCLRRELLMELLRNTAEEGRHDFVVDILYRLRNVKRVVGFELKTYWANIAEVQDYYRANIDFLKPEVRNFFFRTEPRILTKAGDLAPAKFNQGSNVKNTMAASGCFIEGTVENSVLFKQVRIDKGAVVKNCVILNNVHIKADARLDYCIVENASIISEDDYHSGKPGKVRVVVDLENDKFRNYETK